MPFENGLAGVFVWMSKCLDCWSIYHAYSDGRNKEKIDSTHIQGRVK